MPAFDVSIPAGRYVDTVEEAQKWIDRFLETHKENGGLGLDTETSGIIHHKDVALVFSLSDGKDRICVPNHLLYMFKEPILENPEINFDFTNAKFDAHMLANVGVDVSKAGEWRDTIVQSWLLNENNQGRHGLKECIQDYFGRTTPHFVDVFGKTKPATKKSPAVTTTDLILGAFNDPNRRTAAMDYSSLDCYNSTVLRQFFDKRLKIELMYEGMSLYDYFYKVCVPFTKVLWKMERRGITVDAGFLKEQQPGMQAAMLRIEKEFAKAAGKPINLNSPQQLQSFFFDVLKKEPIKWTNGGKTGIRKPSTDADVLDEWAGQNDTYAQLLQEYRGVAKIHNTYVKGLQEWIDDAYRIHTTLKQTGTVTGRLSSSDPNLQNIPRSEEDAFKIRDAFIAGAGKVLIVADYEQLEMRLMAHFSKDRKMIKAIREGIDLHCLTVAEMYGIPYDEVNAAKKADKHYKAGVLGRELTPREHELLFYRQAAKATGFGIIYGIGGEHLAANLTKELKRFVSPDEGFDLIRKWFSVFPSVKDFIDATKNEIRTKGRVQTITGRFRRLGDTKSMSKKDAAQAERQGVNSIIQGTASEIANMVMIKAEDDEELHLLMVEMLLQVHDELVFECPDIPEIIEKAKKRVKEIMEDPFGVPLEVATLVSVGHGYSWASAK